jgi:hypothetical protein
MPPGAIIARDYTDSNIAIASALLAYYYYYCFFYYYSFYYCFFCYCLTLIVKKAILYRA